MLLMMDRANGRISTSPPAVINCSLESPWTRVKKYWKISIPSIVPEAGLGSPGLREKIDLF